MVRHTTCPHTCLRRPVIKPLPLNWLHYQQHLRKQSSQVCWLDFILHGSALQHHQDRSNQTGPICCGRYSWREWQNSVRLKLSRLKLISQENYHILTGKDVLKTISNLFKTMEDDIRQDEKAHPDYPYILGRQVIAQEGRSDRGDIKGKQAKSWAWGVWFYDFQVFR